MVSKFWRHRKTGVLYEALHLVKDFSDERKGTEMVVYAEATNQQSPPQYVREWLEFKDRFEPAVGTVRVTGLSQQTQGETWSAGARQGGKTGVKPTLKCPECNGEGSVTDTEGNAWPCYSLACKMLRQAVDEATKPLDTEIESLRASLLSIAETALPVHDRVRRYARHRATELPNNKVPVKPENEH